MYAPDERDLDGFLDLGQLERGDGGEGFFY